MDLQAVREEITTVLKTITGLRAYSWAQPTVVPPAALLLWPEEIVYNGTYGRGMTSVPNLPLLVLVGKSSERVASKRLGEYVSDVGAKSIPAKLENRAGLWVSCDVVTVTQATFQQAVVGANEYLAVEFTLDIVGKGA